MKQIFCLLLLTAFSAVGFAQSKTITNADLEKFREKRLAAEKEMRENYRELGFPSPEELAKQNEESAKDLAERSERYRRQQNERRQQQEFVENSPNVVYYYPQNRRSTYSGYYRYGVAPGYYYRRGYQKRFRRTRQRGPGYISNPIIRNNWRRQSAPMRRTYRNRNTQRGTRRW